MKQIKTFHQVVGSEGLQAITAQVNEFLAERPDAEVTSFGTVAVPAFVVWYAVVQYEAKTASAIEWRDRK